MKELNQAKLSIISDKALTEKDIENLEANFSGFENDLEAIALLNKVDKAPLIASLQNDLILLRSELAQFRASLKDKKNKNNKSKISLQVIFAVIAVDYEKLIEGLATELDVQEEEQTSLGRTVTDGGEAALDSLTTWINSVAQNIGALIAQIEESKESRESIQSFSAEIVHFEQILGLLKLFKNKAAALKSKYSELEKGINELKKTYKVGLLLFKNQRVLGKKAQIEIKSKIHGLIKQFGNASIEFFQEIKGYQVFSELDLTSLTKVLEKLESTESSKEEVVLAPLKFKNVFQRKTGAIPSSESKQEEDTVVARSGVVSPVNTKNPVEVDTLHDGNCLFSAFAYSLLAMYEKANRNKNTELTAALGQKFEQVMDDAKVTTVKSLGFLSMMPWDKKVELLSQALRQVAVAQIRKDAVIQEGLKLGFMSEFQSYLEHGENIHDREFTRVPEINDAFLTLKYMFDKLDRSGNRAMTREQCATLIEEYWDKGVALKDYLNTMEQNDRWASANYEGFALAKVFDLTFNYVSVDTKGNRSARAYEPYTTTDVTLRTPEIAELLTVNLILIKAVNTGRTVTHYNVYLPSDIAKETGRAILAPAPTKTGKTATRAISYRDTKAPTPPAQNVITQQEKNKVLAYKLAANARYATMLKMKLDEAKELFKKQADFSNQSLGCDLHFMSKLPTVQNHSQYKGSYIWLKAESALYYIQKNGSVVKVEINDIENLKSVFKNDSEGSKQKLTNEEIENNITSNGGHSPHLEELGRLEVLKDEVGFLAGIYSANFKIMRPFLDKNYKGMLESQHLEINEFNRHFLAGSTDKVLTLQIKLPTDTTAALSLPDKKNVKLPRKLKQRLLKVMSRTQLKDDSFFDPSKKAKFDLVRDKIYQIYEIRKIFGASASTTALQLKQTNDLLEDIAKIVNGIYPLKKWEPSKINVNREYFNAALEKNFSELRSFLGSDLQGYFDSLAVDIANIECNALELEDLMLQWCAHLNTDVNPHTILQPLLDKKNEAESIVNCFQALADNKTKQASAQKYFDDVASSAYEAYYIAVTKSNAIAQQEKQNLRQDLKLEDFSSPEEKIQALREQNEFLKQHLELIKHSLALPVETQVASDKQAAEKNEKMLTELKTTAEAQLEKNSQSETEIISQASVPPKEEPIRQSGFSLSRLMSSKNLENERKLRPKIYEFGLRRIASLELDFINKKDLKAGISDMRWIMNETQEWQKNNGLVSTIDSKSETSLESLVKGYMEEITAYMEKVVASGEIIDAAVLAEKVDSIPVQVPDTITDQQLASYLFLKASSLEAEIIKVWCPKKTEPVVAEEMTFVEAFQIITQYWSLGDSLVSQAEKEVEAAFEELKKSNDGPYDEGNLDSLYSAFSLSLSNFLNILTSPEYLRAEKVYCDGIAGDVGDENQKSRDYIEGSKNVFAQKCEDFKQKRLAQLEKIQTKKENFKKVLSGLSNLEKLQKAYKNTANIQQKKQFLQDYDVVIKDIDSAFERLKKEGQQDFVTNINPHYLPHCNFYKEQKEQLAEIVRKEEEESARLSDPASFPVPVEIKEEILLSPEEQTARITEEVTEKVTAELTARLYIDDIKNNWSDIQHTNKHNTARAVSIVAGFTVGVVVGSVTFAILAGASFGWATPLAILAGAAAGISAGVATTAGVYKAISGSSNHNERSINEKTEEYLLAVLKRCLYKKAEDDKYYDPGLAVRILINLLAGRKIDQAKASSLIKQLNTELNANDAQPAKDMLAYLEKYPSRRGDVNKKLHEEISAQISIPKEIRLKIDPKTAAKKLRKLLTKHPINAPYEDCKILYLSIKKDEKVTKDDFFTALYKKTNDKYKSDFRHRLSHLFESLGSVNKSFDVEALLKHVPGILKALRNDKILLVHTLQFLDSFLREKNAEIGFVDNAKYFTYFQDKVISPAKNAINIELKNNGVKKEERTKEISKIDNAWKKSAYYLLVDWKRSWDQEESSNQPANKLHDVRHALRLLIPQETSYETTSRFFDEKVFAVTSDEDKSPLVNQRHAIYIFNNIMNSFSDGKNKRKPYSIKMRYALILSFFKLRHADFSDIDGNYGQDVQEHIAKWLNDLVRGARSSDSSYIARYATKVFMSIGPACNDNTHNSTQIISDIINQMEPELARKLLVCLNRSEFQQQRMANANTLTKEQLSVMRPAQLSERNVVMWQQTILNPGSEGATPAAYANRKKAEYYKFDPEGMDDEQKKDFQDRVDKAEALANQNIENAKKIRNQKRSVLKGIFATLALSINTRTLTYRTSDGEKKLANELHGVKLADLLGRGNRTTVLIHSDVDMLQAMLQGDQLGVSYDLALEILGKMSEFQDKNGNLEFNMNDENFKSNCIAGLKRVYPTGLHLHWNYITLGEINSLGQIINANITRARTAEKMRKENEKRAQAACDAAPGTVVEEEGTLSMFSRAAASHTIEIVDKHAVEKPLSPKNPKNIKKFAQGALQDVSSHFGMNIAVGGAGNFSDIDGKVILDDGCHGHLYANYLPATADQPGGMLVGVEGSEPQKTDIFGHKHNALAKPGQFSPTGNPKWKDERFQMAMWDLGQQEIPKKGFSAELTAEDVVALFDSDRNKFDLDDLAKPLNEHDEAFNEDKKESEFRQEFINTVLLGASDDHRLSLLLGMYDSSYKEIGKQYKLSSARAAFNIGNTVNETEYNGHVEKHLAEQIWHWLAKLITGFSNYDVLLDELIETLNAKIATNDADKIKYEALKLAVENFKKTLPKEVCLTALQTLFGEAQANLVDLTREKIEAYKKQIDIHFRNLQFIWKNTKDDNKQALFEEILAVLPTKRDVYERLALDIPAELIIHACTGGIPNNSKKQHKKLWTYLFDTLNSVPAFTRLLDNAYDAAIADSERHYENSYKNVLGKIRDKANNASNALLDQKNENVNRIAKQKEHLKTRLSQLITNKFLFVEERDITLLIKKLLIQLATEIKDPREKSLTPAEYKKKYTFIAETLIDKYYDYLKEKKVGQPEEKIDQLIAEIRTLKIDEKHIDITFYNSTDLHALLSVNLNRESSRPRLADLLLADADDLDAAKIARLLAAAVSHGKNFHVFLESHKSKIIENEKEALTHATNTAAGYILALLSKYDKKCEDDTTKAIEKVLSGYMNLLKITNKEDVQKYRVNVLNIVSPHAPENLKPYVKTLYGEKFRHTEDELKRDQEALKSFLKIRPSVESISCLFISAKDINHRVYKTLLALHGDYWKIKDRDGFVNFLASFNLDHMKKMIEVLLPVHDDENVTDCFAIVLAACTMRKDFSKIHTWFNKLPGLTFPQEEHYFAAATLGLLGNLRVENIGGESIMKTSGSLELREIDNFLDTVLSRHFSCLNLSSLSKEQQTEAVNKLDREVNTKYSGTVIEKYYLEKRKDFILPDNHILLEDLGLSS